MRRRRRSDEDDDDDDAVIADTAALDYRPRMHARHGQGAAAAQARSPRSKLSDFFHLWVNNIRLLWGNFDDLAPQLPDAMGNLQSDSKKKQKKRETAAVPTSTFTGELETVEDQRKDKRDQPPKTLDECDEPREPIKISFEKVQTPGHTKRPAPKPPKILLSKVDGSVFLLRSSTQLSIREIFSVILRVIWDCVVFKKMKDTLVKWNKYIIRLIVFAKCGNWILSSIKEKEK